MIETVFETDLDLSRAPHPRLDARLATLVSLGERAYGAGMAEYELASGGIRRGGPLSFVRWHDPELESGAGVDVLVFVTVEEAAVFDRLQARFPSLRIRSRARTIATAAVLLSDLPALESHPGVVAIEWSGSVHPTTSPAATGGACSARSALGLLSAPPEADGRGVIVGVVDVEGIDLYHPAFVDSSGRSRLRAVWDQRTEPDTTTEAAQTRTRELRGGLPQKEYGVLYDHAALDAELDSRQPMPYDVVPHRALKRSHGTASASLAAGLPFGEKGGAGVASGAQVVFVNTWGSGAGSLGAMTELAEGIDFVFQIAEADGLPCVVNISLGDDLGPHSGRSPIDRFIDEKVGPGRAVVVASGNSHRRKKHRAVKLEDGKSATIEVDVGPGNGTHASIEIWYRTGAETGTLDLRLEAPDGEGPTRPIVADGVPRMFDAGDTRALVISTPAVPACPGERMIRIELLPLLQHSELLPGIWKLHLAARGAECEAHAWVDHRWIRFTADGGEDDVNTITTPGCSAEAITVGACDIESGRPCWYSGRGPGRGAVSKPDVLGPGGPVLVAAACSPVRAVDATGTSVAAAIVSGAVALAYQRFGPSLTRAELLDKLVPGSGTRRGEAAGPGRVHLAHWFSGEAAGRSEGDGAPGPLHFGGAGAEKKAGPDSAQIMLGTYSLHQGLQLVGWLLVEPGWGEGRTVEHWLLSGDYRPPSAEVPRAQLRFVYHGEPITPEALRARATSRATWIRAECVSRRVVKSAADLKTPVFVLNDRLASSETPDHRKRMSTMTEMNHSRPAVGVQIMLGEYILIQDREVGRLYVEELAGPTRTREHWILYSSYRWPSVEYQTQQITFRYERAPQGLTAFLSRAPAGSTYVVADCSQQTLP